MLSGLRLGSASQRPATVGAAAAARRQPITTLALPTLHANPPDPFPCTAPHRASPYLTATHPPCSFKCCRTMCRPCGRMRQQLSNQLEDAESLPRTAPPPSTRAHHPSCCRTMCKRYGRMPQ